MRVDVRDRHPLPLHVGDLRGDLQLEGGTRQPAQKRLSAERARREGTVLPRRRVPGADPAPTRTSLSSSRTSVRWTPKLRSGSFPRERDRLGGRRRSRHDRRAGRCPARSKQSIVAWTVSADAPKSSALRTSLAICENGWYRTDVRWRGRRPGGLVESGEPGGERGALEPDAHERPAGLLEPVDEGDGPGAGDASRVHALPAFTLTVVHLEQRAPRGLGRGDLAGDPRAAPRRGRSDRRSSIVTFGWTSTRIGVERTCPAAASARNRPPTASSSRAETCRRRRPPPWRAPATRRVVGHQPERSRPVASRAPSTCPGA